MFLFHTVPSNKIERISEKLYINTRIVFPNKPGPENKIEQLNFRILSHRHFQQRLVIEELDI